MKNLLYVSILFSFVSLNEASANLWGKPLHALCDHLVRSELYLSGGTRARVLKDCLKNLKAEVELIKDKKKKILTGFKGTFLYSYKNEFHLSGETLILTRLATSLEGQLTDRWEVVQLKLSKVVAGFERESGLKLKSSLKVWILTTRQWGT